MYRGRAQGSSTPLPRAWIVAALAILACLSLGVSAASGEEAEGGGGETTGSVETTTDPPTETESTTTESTSTESGTTTESTKTDPEPPTHPTETTAESPTAAPTSPTAPTNQAAQQTPTGSTTTTATRRHAPSRGSSHASHHASLGTGAGIRVPNPLKSIGSGVSELFSGALAPRQLESVGTLLAKVHLAPTGNKPAQRRAARKITNALGAALLGSAVGLTQPKPPPAPQPIPFVPIHGGPRYLYVALLALLLGAVGVVLFFQLRPVVRSRRSRPPLISSLDLGPGPAPGPGRVALPRDPARVRERGSPARRETR
jgi:hypothetical protein